MVDDIYESVCGCLCVCTLSHVFRPEATRVLYHLEAKSDVLELGANSECGCGPCLGIDGNTQCSQKAIRFCSMVSCVSICTVIHSVSTVERGSVCLRQCAIQTGEQCSSPRQPPKVAPKHIHRACEFRNLNSPCTHLKTAERVEFPHVLMRRGKSEKRDMAASHAFRRPGNHPGRFPRTPGYHSVSSAMQLLQVIKS